MPFPKLPGQPIQFIRFDDEGTMITQTRHLHPTEWVPWTHEHYYLSDNKCFLVDGKVDISIQLLEPTDRIYPFGKVKRDFVGELKVTELVLNVGTVSLEVDSENNAYYFVLPNKEYVGEVKMV